MPGTRGEVVAVWVVSASGGLSYAHSTSAGAKAFLPTNERLRLASLVHSLHTVASSVSPVFPSPPSACALRSLSAGSLTVHVLKARTGPSFVAISSPPSSDLSPPRKQPATAHSVLSRVYEAYADLVLKDPFHEEDMPIHNPHFDAAVSRIASTAVGALLA